MVYRQRFLFLLLCLASISASAQDLTGIWRGHFNSGDYGSQQTNPALIDRYKYEVQIKQSNKGFEGVTYSYQSTSFYGKASCAGTISTKSKKVLLTETKMLELQSVGGDACLMTLFVQYSKMGEEEFLEGNYTSISTRDSARCRGGTVFLRKVSNSDFYKEPFLAETEKPKAEPPATKITPAQPEEKPRATTPKPAPKATPPATTNKKPPTASNTQKPKPPVNKPKATTPAAPKKQLTTITPKNNNQLKKVSPDSIEKEIPKPSAPVAIPQVLSTRQNELVKTIVSSAKEVFIKIYDNGTVDNDTVSVYVDNKLVISKQRLTEKAITLSINLEDDVQYHELVMVAENLGEIPPNTSLMIVNAGEQEYEVRITSNEQKNAVVRFKSKK